MTHLNPLLSPQPYQASHIFPGPTAFTKVSMGGWQRLVIVSKGMGKDNPMIEEHLRASYRMWHVCDHMITCLLGNVSHHSSSVYHHVYHHS
jgi:hypothetical protein